MFNNFLEIIYKVAIYLRLSKEDESSEQSESIANQKEFITQYVIEQGWNIVDIYIDDGYSGLNYDRPDFKRMIADIESKKVNLVITKDLSRLGRDYIDTGYYLERYFPEKNVRYIALGDGIDTFSQSNNNDMSPFKSVINDMYAKDISKKVRIAMDTKRKNGQFIGAFAPYGYIKDPNDKNAFLIDEEAAKVVRRIFNDYMNGISMCGIVKNLNNEGVPCPAKYKLHTSTYKNAMLKKYRWTQETIKNTLTNPSYMGSMTQRRQEKINYKLEKYRKIDRKNWIIVENTHEPIISSEDFHAVQELIEKRIVHYAKPEEAPHLLNGLLFCQDCGAKMTYRRSKSKKMMMLCMTYTKYGPSVCTNHQMYENVVESYVIDELKAMANHTLNDDYYKEFEGLKVKRGKQIETELETISRKLAEVKEIIKGLYLDKLKGVIDEDLFLSMSGEYNEEKEFLSQKYIKLADKMKAEQAPKTPIDYMSIIKEISNFDIVEKSILFKLIDRVEITAEKEIVVNWKFSNPYVSIV
ncbi:MAG: recombinase family protein [Oscillospiraceae bacterium]|nr:recombinase family protein [Oscillospiraceae bacterium]